MENALVSLPAAFVASTVKLNVPDAEDVPDITPADERVRPPGRLPTTTFQVAASPLAVRAWKYTVPMVLFGNDGVTMAGGNGTVLMNIESTFVSFPASLVALTVKVNIPSVVGVPDIVPFDERLNPPGRLPAVMDQAIVGSPVAIRV